ncbi:BAG family molecular chaperone regulator 8, chloroplastic-like [Durio zibethinus]|uniref:BAG family molecular chaperone regulator 8, chloroplastic-like n=1 Tax=Durio zibethinus TaxID=66656 RepID=A0A6P5YLZ7_DURZI|nr:BAG family molecular chaperone regulator 8, chloroplastic-like [Durio zibethinus]
MASHHHHYHRTTSCCSTCSGSHCCQPPPSPPLPQQSDPLLQALASLLLQTQHPQSQQNHYLNQNQTYFLKPFQDQNSASIKRHLHQKHHHLQEPNSLLSSLVSRINALEASLQHFSQTSKFYSYPSCSLKDAAARVIQTHFRAFLVRRSRTLRQLKDLAFIKSSLNSLKLSISNKTHFDCEAVSQKAMDLLLQLDSFQGGDPMIRDGKRSVSRDLVHFLEYIDGLALKRHNHLYKNAKNMRILGNGSKARILRSNSGEIMQKLRDRVEKLDRFSSNEEGDDDVDLEGFHQVISEGENPRISITGKGGICVTQNRNGGVLVKSQGSQPRVKKTVSFAENANVYRIISGGNAVSSSGDGSLTDESVSSDDHGEIVENLCKQSGGLAENEEEVNLDNEQCLLSSHGEKNTRKNMSRHARSEIDGDYQVQDGDFVFSAPLPVKMESKADLMKKRKDALKIVS